MPLIDPERVETMFRDCLFTEGEPTDGYVAVRGITANYGLHPERLELHREEVEQMLANLPNEFQEHSGGGMSFLKACEDKDGEQWTGLHRRMEELFSLGMGLRKVKCLMPKELWPMLPGGMPYYVVLTEAAPLP